jgi:hypothetical protein
MYPKALRCVIGYGLPERRQQQLRRVETGLGFRVFSLSKAEPLNSDLALGTRFS